MAKQAQEHNARMFEILRAIHTSQIVDPVYQNARRFHQKGNYSMRMNWFFLAVEIASGSGEAVTADEDNVYHPIRHNAYS